MRISDWSSDVCSSDLHEAVIAQEIVRAGLWGGFGTGNSVSSGIVAHYILAYGTEAQRHRWLPRMATGALIGAVAMTEPRSEERRVGKGGVSTCRFRWSPSH